MLYLTFPLLSDLVTLRRFGKSNGWDPDKHSQFHSASEWFDLIESCGFRLEKSRASTMFPPLHRYGFRKFWLTSPAIRRFDIRLCDSFFKCLGQAMACIFVKY